MTPVYSGGLMYEYALEANGYGIAKIQGDAAVQEKDGFAQFADALKANPAPSGGDGKGGAEATSHGVACPTRDGSWLVEGTLLPAIPEGGKQVCLFFSVLFWGLVGSELGVWDCADCDCLGRCCLRARARGRG